jgi:NTE family protein
VIVTLGEDSPTSYAVDYDAIPGPRQLAAAMLNPFSRKRLPQVPGILQVIILSMLANRSPDLQLSETDILVRPELPENLRYTNWERHNQTFQHAYRGTAAWIQAGMAEKDARLAAVMGMPLRKGAHGIV